MTGSTSRAAVETVEYSWEFLGIHSIWTQSTIPSQDAHSPGQSHTQSLLCFDLNTRMQSEIHEHFKASAGEFISKDPFGVHATFLEPLIIEYERTLWGFRTPVRKYEKV